MIQPSTIVAWRDALGGRRFLMCMGAHFVNTVLLACHLLSENGYLITFNGTIAVYLAASGWQKHVESKNAESS